MYVCTICDRFAGKSFVSVLRHIGSTHRYDPGLSIRCGIQSCPETYTNFESFRSHVYRKHRDVLHLNSSSTQPESGSQDPSTICDNPLDHDSLHSNIHDLQTSATNGINLQLGAAKFLLQIKEECKLTQASVNKIVSSVRGLWSEAMCNVRERLKQDTAVNIDESIFDDTLMALRHSIYRRSTTKSTLIMWYAIIHYSFTLIFVLNALLNVRRSQLSVCLDVLWEKKMGNQ